MNKGIIYLGFLLISLALGCAQSEQTLYLKNDKSSHIINGQLVLDEKIKQATVLIGASCTGSYIGENFVITAAHCYKHFLQPQFKKVTFNFKNIKCPISSYVIHKDYIDSRYINDIALLKIKCADADQSLIQQITPFQIDKNETSRVGAYKAAGYGTTEWQGPMMFSKLRYVEFDQTSTPNEIMADYQAYTSSKQQEYKNYFWGLLRPFVNSTMDLLFKVRDNKTVYHGDSGGPLYFYDSNNEFYLAGVTSFGIKNMSSQKFFSPKTDVVYGVTFVNVFYFSGWIEETKRPRKI